MLELILAHSAGRSVMQSPSLHLLSSLSGRQMCILLIFAYIQKQIWNKEAVVFVNMLLFLT